MFRFPCGYVDPPRLPTRPGKTVRIASPPTERIPISPMTEDEIESPVFNFHNVVNANHRGSPPPLSRGDTTSSSDDEDEEEEGGDPFNPNNPDSSGSENEEAVRNTFRQQKRNSWSLTVDPAGLSSVEDKKPEDPAQGKNPRPMSFAGGSEASLSKGGSDGNGSSGKAALDVDSFKRLLLTGDAGGQANETTLGHQSSKTIASGEDTTDTTTTASSRYPALDAGSSLPSSTPKGPSTSVNDPGTISGPKERKKPPPPKTRHGKPIKSDEPQMAASPAPTPQRSTSSLSTSYNPVRQGSGSFPDTNSSLPVSQTNSVASPPADSSVVSSPPETLSSVPPQFKKPPTPPLARRQSQLRSSKNALSRSNSGRIPLSSTNSANAMSTPTHRVPPPPPRRQERTSITPPSDTSSQHKVPFPAVSGGEPGDEESISQQSPSRTPSISSGKQHHRPPNSQPPRPPPRRRLRGSSQSSANSTNPTTATHEISKSSENAAEGSVKDTSNANDILADLSKLQKEVDDLRGQYQTRTQQ